MDMISIYVNNTIFSHRTLSHNVIDQAMTRTEWITHSILRTHILEEREREQIINLPKTLFIVLYQIIYSPRHAYAETF